MHCQDAVLGPRENIVSRGSCGPEGMARAHFARKSARWTPGRMKEGGPNVIRPSHFKLPLAPPPTASLQDILPTSQLSFVRSRLLVRSPTFPSRLEVRLTDAPEGRRRH